jgi:hypothetical protein
MIGRQAVEAGYMILGGTIYVRRDDGVPDFDSPGWSYHAEEGSWDVGRSLDAMTRYFRDALSHSGPGFISRSYVLLDLERPADAVELSFLPGISIEAESCAGNDLAVSVDVTSPSWEMSDACVIRVPELLSFAAALEFVEKWSGVETARFLTPASEDLYAVDVTFQGTRLLGEVLVKIEGQRRDGLRGFAGDTYFLVPERRCVEIGRELGEMTKQGGSVEWSGKWALPVALQ